METLANPAPDHPIDLTNCDREPIQFLGNVQSFGCLIAVSSDWIVTHVSDNCAKILELESPIIVGEPLPSQLPESVIHTLRTRLQTSAGAADGRVRIFGVRIVPDGAAFDVSIHQTGRSFVIEFEPMPAERSTEDLGVVQSLIARVSEKKTLEDRCAMGARALRALIGFDRVMVYRFNEDDSGTVIAETAAAGLVPYRGLRFPASDIPKQARELYKRSTLRLIADVDDDVSQIRPEHDPSGQPLDLSLSVTRAVSPIHLEYLRNMGVSASMSVSIVLHGKLWGLFACHNMTPKYVDFHIRTMVELFAQLFTYELAQAENEIEFDARDKARALHDKVMSRLSEQNDLSDDFELVAEQIADVISYDGIALYTEGRYLAIGSAPTEEEFIGLARFLNTTTTSNVYTTTNLSAVYPKAEALTDRVAGLLALPVSRSPRDYIVLFRREQRHSVTWAGDPSKPAEPGPNGLRLTPRRSFDAWTEEVHGTSLPWTSSEVRAAEAVRVTMIEVVLRITDDAVREREAASEKQELLIAELNHRVRNILNLIRGLMTQTRATAGTLQDYSKQLNDRIHSLARAHDQLTASQWEAAPLRELIQIETDAFSGGKADRVHVSGDKVALRPNAYSTMALLVHELMTNAAKYGALSDSLGRVDVNLSHDPDGTLRIDWVEKGGPAVAAPTRQGFGSTIIRRSVPYELGGDADVHFDMTGVKASFRLPARHVVEVKADEQSPELNAPTATEIGHAVPEEMLIVEDNMIIALDLVDQLTEFGVKTVHTAASVGDALSILDTLKPGAALLDVNLGSETSILIAERLTELDTPFILATGYGGETVVLKNYPNVPVIKKPFQSDALKAAITRLASDP